MKVKTVNLRTLLPSLAIPLAVGLIGTYFVLTGLPSYRLLDKPPLTPPAWVFGVVWTILYVLMGIAAYRVKSSNCYDKQSALQLYYIQLALNLMWTLLFFRFNVLWGSAVLLLILLAAVVFTTVRFSQCDVTAGKLLLPYILWCAFALYLNIGIAVLN